MANNSDEEDALDMSLKLGDRQLGVRESRSQAEAGNRRKIPLARIERRSLGGGEGGETGQKGMFTTFSLEKKYIFLKG